MKKQIEAKQRPSGKSAAGRRRPPNGSRRISVRLWTTTDNDAYNAGHQLVIPGRRATADDQDLAADFFQTGFEQVKSRPSSMTIREYNKLAEAEDA